MVKAKSARTRRRNRGAGPERDGDDDVDAIPVSARDPYPNMTAQREMDLQEHVKRARQMGATRKQASKHADLEAGGH